MKGGLPQIRGRAGVHGGTGAMEEPSTKAAAGPGPADPDVLI